MKPMKRNPREKSLTLVMLGVLMLFGSITARRANAGGAPDRRGRVIAVSTTIQAAVDEARPGDTVLVRPGTYQENVTVTKDNITIRGSRGATMDGAGLAGSTGIRVTPITPTSRVRGFNLSGLTIRNYSRTGVFLSRVDDFRVSQGTYVDNDEYGVFPIFSSGGLIDLNHVSGSNDTGIYVGQSSNVAIEKNQTRDCTLGIEIENSTNIAIRENTSSDNSIGILVQLLPGLDRTATTDVSVSKNVLIGNNRPNPATDPGDLLSLLPSGVGFFNVAGDRVNVRENIVLSNNSVGILVAQLPPALAALDPRINPLPDNNEIRDNVALQNGRHPDPKLGPFPGSDLLWDFSGAGNCWASNVFSTAFPVPLPSCS